MCVYQCLRRTAPCKVEGRESAQSVGNTAGTSAASQYAAYTGFSTMPSSGTADNHKNTHGTKTFNTGEYKLILHEGVSALYFLSSFFCLNFKLLLHSSFYPFTKWVICPY